MDNSTQNPDLRPKHNTKSQSKPDAHQGPTYALNYWQILQVVHQMGLTGY
jgi:hypothetical protein